MDSETILRTLFNILYPDKKLCDLSDWALLESNGGPLTESEYFSNTSIYKSVPNVVIQHGKREYMKVSRE